MLHEEHIAADGVARVPSCIPPEHAGDQSAEQRGQREGVGHAADEEQSADTAKTRSSVSDEARVKQQPGGGRQRQGDTARLRQQDEPLRRESRAEPRQHEPARQDRQQDSRAR